MTKPPLSRTVIARSAAAVLVMGAGLAASTARSAGWSGPAPAAGEVPPAWAFAINPPPGSTGGRTAPAGPLDHGLRHVPGSTAAFTDAQVRDFFFAPDWHPEAHPAMPEIVALGRKPQIYACAYCHLPNGEGRPENSRLAGLPADYILRQLADFRGGRRKSAQPEHLPTAYMITVSQVSETDAAVAARYFAGLTPHLWIRVVETATVPQTHVAGWMLVPTDSDSVEALGERIVETPANLERTELRDDSSGFVAYVPVGSIKKGEALVRGGDVGKTVPCSSCHGADLKGVGNIPSIAGRSPSYVVRQLYNIQHGARAGAGALLMQAPVAQLTLADMVSIAAYTATLPP
jgi:cytochrome c553